MILLLKGINQQLIVMQKFIVTVYNSFNKDIGEEEKNKAMSSINKLEGKTVQYDITNFIQ